MSKNVDDPNATSLYRMQAVVNLTGLKAPVIRAWERRYGVPQPRRTESGYRLYSDDDVVRLQFLRALRECGEAVGSVAHLGTDQLRERLAAHTGEAGLRHDDSGASKAVQCIAVIEPQLGEQLRVKPMKRLKVVAEAGSLDGFLSLSPRPPVDALVVGLPLLGSEPVERLRDAVRLSGARTVLVLFDYAREDTLAELADVGARLMRMPVRISALGRALMDVASVQEIAQRRAHAPVSVPRLTLESDPAPVVFNEAALARLLQTDTDVECGCPNHVAALVSALRRFEVYSETCVVDQPGESELHRSLARGTGHARALMESLLVQLCEADGLPAP